MKDQRVSKRDQWAAWLLPDPFHVRYERLFSGLSAGLDCSCVPSAVGMMEVDRISRERIAETVGRIAADQVRASFPMRLIGQTEKKRRAKA